MKKLNIPKHILVALLIAGVVVIGHIVTYKLAGQKNNVCSSELIAQYNTTFSAETQEQYSERLKSAAGKVDELKNADKDPNCVFIQYTYYIETKDTAKARERLNVLKKLAEKDSYITGELANPQGLDSAEQTLSILEASKNRKPGSDGQENVRGEG